MMRRLLLVEDDRALSIGLHDAFAQEGFAVTVARDGDKGRALLCGGEASMAAPPFDVVVLDLMLPGRSGLDLLRELRGSGGGGNGGGSGATVPVLLLTARGSETDKVLGLELGADDYVTKPFSLRELVARVRALVRREERRGSDGDAASGGGGSDGAREHGGALPSRFTIGAAEVDLAAFELRRGGVAHPLSKKEAALLALLWRRRGSVVTRQQFLREVWGGGEHVGSRTIDTHMLNVRQKLEDDPAAPRFLLTVHGVGYRLAVE
ncbi:MAG: response regulator transcription factor [Planctomycetes bacterium]|nr:response regulator transcription factor [Planctomycetota bacterium]